jgi:S-DNA-T family DNA segregation ATPase FtsK/SpoIIIE
MSRIVLHRPARRWPAAVPTEEIAVVAPPAAPAKVRGGLFQLLLPMMSACGSVAFIIYFPSALYIAVSLAVTAASIGLGFGMFVQQRAAVKQQGLSDRGRYLGYLRELRRQAIQVARSQDEAAQFIHPDLTGLWAIACQRVRVWERRPEHGDFVTVRVGHGSVPLAAPLRLDMNADPLADRRQDLVAAATRLVTEHGTVPGQPVLLDLRAHPAVSLLGPVATGRRVAQAMVAELATLCAPDDLMISVCADPETVAQWQFAKWLPHTEHGGGRLLCTESAALAEALSDEVAARRERARRRSGLRLDNRDDEPGRHLLVIVDGYSAASRFARLELLTELAERGEALAASVVFIVGEQRDEPPAVNVRVRVRSDERFAVETAHGEVQTGAPDEVGDVVLEALGRQLAPLRLSGREARAALSETCRLVDLLGAQTAAQLDIPALWQRRTEHDVLRVPIGVGADGRPEILDLKESALGGMGPHGLLIGATGSGKSELLRSLVTALALTHPPDVLNFALVDFKGGAAFAGLAELPHVAGMITNLADDLTMVDRMRSALFGEQQRRQRLLREVGNLDNVREYQRRRAAGQLGDAEPLPYLLVVVDEFGELLANRPDFLDLFVAIGRVGRSLGMHLLLASQRLDEGRLRGLDSHLSYRIALRTFSSSESHAVLGTPDAYHLPAVPGSAYLKVDTSIYERFKCALSSGPERQPGERAGVEVRAQLFTGTPLAPGLTSRRPDPSADVTRPSEMQVCVQRVLATGASAVHKVWLPPLPAAVSLQRLLPALGQHPSRGTQALTWPHLGSITAPIGVADLPEEPAQRTFLLDFTGWAGHLAVVGAPQSGKSTLLRTVVTSLIATHTPDEARIYAVDYGGGSLFPLAGAPHIGDVCGRLEPDKARRVITHVRSLIDEREARFRDLAIDSPTAMREQRASGVVGPEFGSDVFLVIDGWGSAREDLADLEQEIVDVAARGLRVGVHLVLTANRWHEVRPNLRDNIGGRLELRLNEPGESEIDRRAAAALPVNSPGRALAPDGHQIQVALPELGYGVEEFVASLGRGWRGDLAPAVRLLPSVVTPDMLAPGDTDPALGVAIGVDEFQLAPVHLDLAGADPHFVVLGDAESGKTTLLRSWLAGLQARHGPDEAMVLVVDYRRTLLEAVPAEQLWAYCGAAPAAQAAVHELAEGIVERLPPATLPAQAIAERSWWTGPEFYVVVDDYDLVVSAQGNPLLPLLELLPQGRDLGLHLVLARRVGGMARAGMEPVLNRLRELHSPGIILSGDPAEGPLLAGCRATPQPPGRGVLVRRKQRPTLVQVVDHRREVTAGLAGPSAVQFGEALRDLSGGRPARGQ